MKRKYIFKTDLLKSKIYFEQNILKFEFEQTFIPYAGSSMIQNSSSSKSIKSDELKSCPKGKEKSEEGVEGDL